jgi:hypothetical protein
VGAIAVLGIVVGALGLVAAPAGAQDRVVEPGQMLSGIDADGGVVLESCDSGEGRRCRAEIVAADSALELVVSAETQAEGRSVEASAAAALFADFSVGDTPTGESNEVLGVVSLVVQRTGLLEATGKAGARARVEVSVTDRESGSLVGQQTLGPDVLETSIGSVEMNGETVRVRVPASRRVNETAPVMLTVALRRGRSYRVELRAAVEASATDGRALSDFGSEGDARREDRRIWWRDLSVRISDDPFDSIEDLADDLDALEDAFRNHTHEYLTGRGVGHNNTVAATSAPDAPVPTPHDDDDGTEHDDGTNGWSPDVTVHKLTSDRPGGASRGSRIRFRADVTGPSEVEYRWWVLQYGNWYLMRDWVRGGAGMEFDWTPSSADAGTLIGIWVQPVGRPDMVRYYSVPYPID